MSKTKTLVAYFSATGKTAKLAASLSDAVGGDLYEIKAKLPYTRADLDWTNKKSRSSVEMSDKSYRPAVEGRNDDMAQYDVVFVGFPIWWYVAPTIINTFLEQYDFTGKTIIPFATSGSSQMGNTNKELAYSCPGAFLKEGKRFDSLTGKAELKAWADSLGI